MKERVIKVLFYITISLIIILEIIFIIEFKEMLNDHRCYNLPLNEFFQDKKCEKYWRYR